MKFVLKNKFHFPFDLSQIALPKSAAKCFKSEKYDAVYINGYIRGALPIIRLSKSPVVIHHHVVTDILKESTIHGQELLDGCSRMLFVSEFAVRFTQGLTDVQKNKISAFENAIDTSKFKFENPQKIKNEIRSQYGIKPDDIVILFVGRMVADKGAYELISAFNQCNFDENVKLFIVGGSTYNSKKVTAYVKRCLDESRKNKNIIMTGYVPYENIPKYYIASDISTLLSRCNEACGLVGIESMAAGLPVITTDRGGIGEYVTDECKIVTPDDEHLTDSIAAAMRTLIKNDTLREKMGDAGIERAKLFDKVTYFQRFKRIMDEVIENHENI